MENVVNIYEAKANFSALVARAQAGEEIIIAQRGKPACRLVPLDLEQSIPRQPYPGASIQGWLGLDLLEEDPEWEAVVADSEEKSIWPS
jgi:prevent-host-death family protein